MRTDPIVRSRGRVTRRHDPAVPRPDAIAAGPDSPAAPDPFEHLLPDPEASSEPAAHADRRNVRSKLAAGYRGLKAAVRGDSSFFAHTYRGTLIAITAALLGINQWGWCLLVLGASLVLMAELTHSAVDTLARAIGDPEEPRLKTAREIAAAVVLVAAFGAGAVTLMVLSSRFLDLLGWRL
jgi:diacylglycerol kinase